MSNDAPNPYQADSYQNSPPPPFHTSNERESLLYGGNPNVHVDVNIGHHAGVKVNVGGVGVNVGAHGVGVNVSPRRAARSLLHFDFNDMWYNFKLDLYRFAREFRRIEFPDLSHNYHTFLLVLKHVATEKQKELAARRLPVVVLWLYALLVIYGFMFLFSIILFASKSGPWICLALLTLALIPFSMFCVLKVLVSEELNFDAAKKTGLVAEPKRLSSQPPPSYSSSSSAPTKSTSYGSTATARNYESIRDIEDQKQQASSPQANPLAAYHDDYHNGMYGNNTLEARRERERHSVFYILYVYCIIVGLTTVFVVAGAGAFIGIAMEASALSAVGGATGGAVGGDGPDVGAQGSFFVFVLTNYLLTLATAGIPVYMLLLIERFDNPYHDQSLFKYAYGRFSETWLFENEETRGLWHNYHFTCFCVPYLRETLQITTHRIVIIRNLLFYCWWQPDSEYVMAWLRDLPSIFIGPPAMYCCCCKVNPRGTTVEGLSAGGTCDCINWPCCPYELVRVGEPGRLNVIARMQSRDVSGITNCYFEVQESWKMNQGPSAIPGMNEQQVIDMQHQQYHQDINNNSINGNSATQLAQQFQAVHQEQDLAPPPY